MVFRTNRDFDSTVIVFGLLILFALLILAIFISDWAFGTALLTEALLHTLLGFTGGWISAMVTFFFGKKLAEQQANNGQQQQEEETKK